MPISLLPSPKRWRRVRITIKDVRVTAAAKKDSRVTLRQLQIKRIDFPVAASQPQYQSAIRRHSLKAASLHSAFQQKPASIYGFFFSILDSQPVYRLIGFQQILINQITSVAGPGHRAQ